MELESKTEYDLLQQETDSVNTLVKEARKEFELLPLFKAIRRASITLEDSEKTSPEPKRVKRNEETKATADRSKLMNRLASFTFLFHYLARPLTALTCAQHGWKDTKSVVEKDPKICVLTCEDCENDMFVIDFDSSLDLEKATAISKKYQDGLYSCHKVDCLWRQEKCQDDLYCFPIYSLAEGLDRFQSEAQRIHLACSRKYTIKHPLDEKTLSKINYFSKTTSTDAIDAFVLSLFGWKSLDPSISAIECDLCFTRKRLNEETFNVLENHKSYCPWKNATTANAYTPRGFIATAKNQSMTGWEWLLEAIKMEYSLQMRKEDLSLSARHAIDEKFYSHKQTLYQSYDLLEQWKATIEKLE